MTQGIEMKRAAITLLAFLNPPIDWDDSFNMLFLVRN
jgi:hypothetical protein